MFTTFQFIIAKSWKQPKYPVGEWVNKLLYIHTAEYYSAIKKEQTMDTRNNMGGFLMYYVK